MRYGMRQEIDWEYLGALLARADDNEQSAFLKSFVKECNSWGTHFQVESQLAGVNLKLTREEKETLRMITYEEVTP